MNILRFKLTVTILSIFFYCSCGFLAYANEDAKPASSGMITGAKDAHYANASAGFIFHDPLGWSVLTQSEDEKGQPVYKLPPGLRHVARKEYPDKPGHKGAMMHIYVVAVQPDEPNLTAMQLSLNKFSESATEESVLIRPETKILGDREWVIASYKMAGSTPGSLYFHRAYVIRHKEHFIMISSFAPMEEYEQITPVFDETVSRVEFTDVTEQGLLKRAAQELVATNESSR